MDEKRSEFQNHLQNSPGIDKADSPQTRADHCRICEDESHGVHFGVPVCRACAAFFRRSTISGRKYQCRFDGKCPVGRDLRCSCRACRLQKCRDVGMDPESVQRNRDQIGPRRTRWNSTSTTKSSQGSAEPQTPNSSFGMLSFIESDNEQQPKKVKGNLQIEGGTTGLNVFSTRTSTSHNSAFQPNTLPIYPTVQDSTDPSKSYTLLTSSTTPTFVVPSPSTSSQQQQQQHQQQQPPINNAESDGIITLNSTLYERNIYQILSTFAPPLQPQQAANSNLANRAATNLLNNFAPFQMPSTSSQPPQSSTNLASAFTPLQDSSLFSSSAPTSSSAMSWQTVINVGEGTSTTPIIDQMQIGYKKFLALRHTASTLLQQNGTIYKLLTNNLTLSVGTYFDDVMTLKSDLSLLSELINNHFVPLASFATKSKWLLLRNFFCPAIILDRTYHTSKIFPNKDDPRIIISPQYYMDTNSLIDYFSVEQCKVEPRKVVGIFEPMFRQMVTLLANPVRRMQMAENEIVALLGLLFWNSRVDGLAANEARLADETQNALFNELHTICRQNANSEGDYGVRFAKLCNLLSYCYKFSNEISTNFSLANVTNSFDVDTFLHNFTPESW